MQIKKYVAPTIKEATQLMKQELGSEAIILGTRVIEGDRTFNRKKMFEITAGLDKVPVKDKVNDNEDKARAEKFSEELEKLTSKIFNSPAASAAKSAETARRPEFKPKKETGYRSSTDEKETIIEREIKELSDVLLAREVQKNLVKNLTTQLGNYKDLVDSKEIENSLLSDMAALIPTSSFKVKKNKTTKVALVGPTGVGKTTCIAKLAVISKIIHKLKVGLISIDTYRLGAIDQLRIFSEISDIEMAVAYEPGDMPELLKKFKDKDLIFIDTVGRSQKNADNLSKIKEYLDAAEVDETLLVLSATSSTRNLLDVAQRFKPLDYSSVIFSKADEAVAYGNILNLAVNQNLPVMFLTNGQVIPDDIISVTPDFLAKLIFTGKLYNE